MWLLSDFDNKAEFRKGKSLSREHKRKISEALKGRGGGGQEDIPAWAKGKPAHMLALANKGRLGFRNVAVAYSKDAKKNIYAHSVYKGPLGMTAIGGNGYRLTRNEVRDFKKKMLQHQKRQLGTR